MKYAAIITYSIDNAKFFWSILWFKAQILWNLKNQYVIANVYWKLKNQIIIKIIAYKLAIGKIPNLRRTLSFLII